MTYFLIIMTVKGMLVLGGEMDEATCYRNANRIIDRHNAEMNQQRRPTYMGLMGVHCEYLD